MLVFLSLGCVVSGDGVEAVNSASGSSDRAQQSSQGSCANAPGSADLRGHAVGGRQDARSSEEGSTAIGSDNRAAGSEGSAASSSAKGLIQVPGTFFVQT